MNIKEFSALLKAKAAELNDFRHRKLPILAGRTAKDHFQENFRQGGFVDGSLHPWQEAQRRKKAEKSFHQIRYIAFRKKPPVQFHQIYSGRLQRHCDKRRGIRSLA